MASRDSGRCQIASSASLWPRGERGWTTSVDHCSLSPSPPRSPSPSLHRSLFPSRQGTCFQFVPCLCAHVTDKVVECVCVCVCVCVTCANSLNVCFVRKAFEHLSV